MRSLACLLAAFIVLCQVSRDARAEPPPAAKPSTTAPPADEMERVMASMRKSMKDAGIARILGFYGARMAVLDRIENEVPSLKDQARAAKSAMADKFGSGYEALLQLYFSRGEKHKAEREAMSESFKQEAAKQDLKEADLKEAFAAGALAPQRQKLSYVLTLLTMNPAHQKQPELAFDDGFTIDLPLSPTDDAHAIGTVKIPATFGVMSGGKPGQPLVLAYAAYAPAVITVTVVEADAALTLQRAIDNLVAAPPKGASIDPKKAKVIETASGPAAIVPMDLTIDTGKAKALGRSVNMILLRDSVMIGVTTSVQAEDGDDVQERLDALGKRFEPLFQRIRDSIQLNKAKAVKDH